ncbi:hypothetical protein M3Y95_01219000 [Aphelenchoides besseyi]|nr:hypothetical protein M3Y95_01219000 [Aphelenchoides besseyi]
MQNPNPIAVARQELQHVVDEGALLAVYTESGVEMMTMIRAFSFRDVIQLRYLHDGLRLVSHDTIEMQGNIYFKKNFFSEYQLGSPQVTFTVRTKHFCQALKIFNGMSYSLQMVYMNEGDALELSVECSNMNAKVTIPTVANDELLDMDSQDEMKLKVLFDPIWMSSLIQDLDQSADYVKMEFYRDDIKVSTNTEKRQIKENREDFLIESCPEDGYQLNYKTTNLARMAKALVRAKKAFFSINDTGVLWVQATIEHSERLNTYVDFWFYSRTDEDDDLNLDYDQINDL